MTSPLGNVPLCMDERMLVAGTGVATYAHALRDAQLEIDPTCLLLSASGSRGTGGWAGLTRAARAVMPWSRTARRSPGRLATFDIFRTAHLFFNYHRRLLPVRADGPAGVMHWSYPVPLYVVGWANLYTVHDVIPLTDPALTPIDPDRHRRLLTCITARAERLVTVSEAARSAIADSLGCPPDAIANCSQPVRADAIARRAPLPSPLEAGRYLLVCGSIEPRKNIARIVAAYRASGTTLPLVFAGPDGWQAETLRAVLAGPGIMRLPYLARPDLLALIANARALIMPSLAEGFGLPVAEAMTLGVPVLTANNGALAETAGGAALLVDPSDTTAMGTALNRLTNDDALCRTLAGRGKIRASHFSPRHFRANLTTLYAACVASRVDTPYAASSMQKDGS